MSAPKTPVATSAPSCRSDDDERLDQRFADRPGRGGAPGGSPALAGVGVQGELADHQDRRVLLGAGALAGQDAQVPDLLGQPRGDRRAVVVGHPDQDQQPGPVDRRRRPRRPPRPRAELTRWITSRIGQTGMLRVTRQNGWPIGSANTRQVSPPPGSRVAPSARAAAVRPRRGRSRGRRSADTAGARPPARSAADSSDTRAKARPGRSARITDHDPVALILDPHHAEQFLVEAGQRVGVRAVDHDAVQIPDHGSVWHRVCRPAVPRTPRPRPRPGGRGRPAR